MPYALRRLLIAMVLVTPVPSAVAQQVAPLTLEQVVTRPSIIGTPPSSPVWSPDSQRLAFWSNRTGTKQIFIMDANGQNIRNISNVPWDEENPVWIK